MVSVERVVLVHGTGATAVSDEGSAWWQRSGSLWLELNSQGLRPEAFIWTGDNSESARRDAGLALARQLKAAIAVGHYVHLVGHSHGGSVITHAMQALDQGERDAILTWTTVGTPYLRYGVRVPRLITDVFVLLVSIAVLVSSISMLLTADVWFAWDHDPLGTAAWFALLGVPSALAGWACLVLIPFLRQIFIRPNLGELVRIKNRHLALWSSQDEPIIGLRSSGSFSLRLLGGKDGGLKATAANQFVNNLVSRALQGSNLPHLEMRGAASAACPDLAHKPLPMEIDNKLIDLANESAARLGLRVREILSSGHDPLTGFADLQRAASNAFTFTELVHTTYFQSQECRDLIVHHILNHATRGKASKLVVPLKVWYSDRFAPKQTSSLTLPANRMGLTAALAIGLSVLVMGLVATSQRLLHDRAFAPTMPTYHLDRLVSSKQLVAALSGIIPGEQLEDAGMNEDFEIDVPGGNSKPNSPALSALRSYIHAITKANQLERLIEASDGLKKSPVLQSLFYTYALSYALDVASRDQLIQLINSSLLPGPALTARVYKVDGVWDMRYPATLVFLKIVAKRKLLDRAILDGILGKCPEKSNCVARAKLAAARVLALAHPAHLDYLVPIPPSFHRVEIVANGATPSQLQSVPLERGTPLTGDDLAYISWIAKHDAWHNSTANGISTGTPMSWAAISPSLSPSIHRVKGEQVNHLLHFIVQALWFDGMPDRDLSQLKLLIPKQVQVNQLDLSAMVPYVTHQAMDEFVARERPRTRCSDLHGIDGDELLRRSSELSNDGVSCLQRDSAQLRERKFRSDLKGVAQESGMLFGEGGRLQKFGKLQMPGSSRISRGRPYSVCSSTASAKLIPAARETSPQEPQSAHYWCPRFDFSQCLQRFHRR